jgi:hypothetical protein
MGTHDEEAGKMLAGYGGLPSCDGKCRCATKVGILSNVTFLVKVSVSMV